jgi:hypothetical protein
VDPGKCKKVGKVRADALAGEALTQLGRRRPALRLEKKCWRIFANFEPHSIDGLEMTFRHAGGGSDCGDLVIRNVRRRCGRVQPSPVRVRIPAPAIGGAIESGMPSNNSFGLVLNAIRKCQESGYGRRSDTETMNGSVYNNFVTQAAYEKRAQEE